MNPFAKSLSTLLFAAALAAPAAFAQVEAKAPAPKPAVKKEPADLPAVKGNPDDPKNTFLKRHEGFLKDLAATHGNVGVLFVGDSITDGWRGGGKTVFEKTYAPLHTLNIGISGDRTQHVLWRLNHGEVDGISPKVAVLMIGTNNLNPNTDDEITAGVTRCVTTLREKLPQTKVLLLAIFPRATNADNPLRTRIKSINAQLAKLDDNGKTTKYLDIGDEFLTPDGTLPKEIMPDALHPNAKGYQIWADAMSPTLDEMMK